MRKGVKRNENGAILTKQNLLEYSYIKDILPRLGIPGPEKDDQEYEDDEDEDEDIWFKYNSKGKKHLFLRVYRYQNCYYYCS
jgi:hypothetical protein